MNIEHSSIQFVDLPSELLLTIFEKLNNVDILYSLMGINARFDKILLNSIFTSSLTLMKYSSKRFFYPLSDIMLHRFCLQILPAIRLKIKWLSMESSTMERILLANEYPNLCGLSLNNLTEESAIRLFVDKFPFIRVPRHQIWKMIITVVGEENVQLTENKMTIICAHVFTIFPALRYFNIHSPYSALFAHVSFNNTLSTFSSSALVELHITLMRVTDTLYLLDGRFNQLRVLCVNITGHNRSSGMIRNEGELPHLRYFSLTCPPDDVLYNDLIVPLLHRMSNLESLALYFESEELKELIDGNNLKKNIINHMTRLNKFSFNIRTTTSVDDSISSLSNNDIQRIFVNLTDNQIISCIDYFPKVKTGQCHIYTHPYTMSYYNNITNNFPGGLFECVREISLFDERPFEYEFFIRIAQAFPFVDTLTLCNRRAQRLKTNNIDYPAIKYSHLRTLDLTEVHKDYVELFLDHTKTILSNDLFFSVSYGSLKKATHNFKREALRTNCAKLRILTIPARFKMSQRFQAYFPHVEEKVFFS